MEAEGEDRDGQDMEVTIVLWGRRGVMEGGREREGEGVQREGEEEGAL